jgi:putative ABC transport system permease protein
VNKSGLTTVRLIDAQTCLSQTAVMPGKGRLVYLLGTEHDSPIGPDSLTALTNLLMNQSPALIPLCRPVDLTLGTGANRRTVTLHSLAASVAPPDVEQTIPPQPWSGPQILLNQGDAGPAISATLPTSRKLLTFPVSLRALAPGQSTQAWAPLDFMGILRAAQVKGVEYDAAEHTFIYARESYAGFRLYARGLDDVDPLRLWFEAHGIDVSTEAERINDVQTLSQALNEIFWILATVGIIGAAATLASSLYSAIIRQRRELCVLKLLGIGTFPLLLYPLVQSITLASASFVSSTLIVYSAGSATDYVFRARMNPGESFVHLPWDQLGITFALVCWLSILASLFAGISVLSLDVAEGIRDE